MRIIYDEDIYMIEGIRFEDIAFYDNDNIVLAVCSHERFANLNLNEKDFEAFQELRIHMSSMTQE